MVLEVKNLAANARDTRDLGSVPGSGRSPGKGNGNPLQYSCLENAMDRGAWWATVMGPQRVRYRLSGWTQWWITSGLSQWHHRVGSRNKVWGLPRWCSGKESAYQCRRCKRCMFNSWVRKIPLRRKWQATPAFLPGESHEQRSLVDCSSWGCKGDMTEHIEYFSNFIIHNQIQNVAYPLQQLKGYESSRKVL